MARHRNTPYDTNVAASDHHRVLGSHIYGADLDMLEYKYLSNGTIVPAAIIDWKYPGDKLGMKYSAIQLQRAVADKLEVPFFMAITYLSDTYPVKCYYVIPCNTLSIKYFYKCVKPINGCWCSLQGFSKLQHALRSQIWNPDEVIDEKNLVAVGLPVGTKLKELPRKIKHYPLPMMESFNAP